VYPVLSRRSGGISIGINVNPDKRCNFDCLYCQVDRAVPPAVAKFDLGQAEAELRALLDLAQSGALARHPQFRGVPSALLRLNDIALSGDAEPTTIPQFAEALAMVARHRPPGVKIILITDAGGLDRADVRRGLAIMDNHQGEVWAKLDAGTAEYYRYINRTKIPFARILKNITHCARDRPIIIQSLFLKVHGRGPGATEVTAYGQRLRDILAKGGRIRLVQICTLARQALTTVDGVPAWQFVASLSDAELGAIADSVHHRTGLTVQCFSGVS